MLCTTRQAAVQTDTANAVPQRAAVKAHWRGHEERNYAAPAPLPHVHKPPSQLKRAWRLRVALVSDPIWKVCRPSTMSGSVGRRTWFTVTLVVQAVRVCKAVSA